MFIQFFIQLNRILLHNFSLRNPPELNNRAVLTPYFAEASTDDPETTDQKCFKKGPMIKKCPKLPELHQERLYTRSLSSCLGFGRELNEVKRDFATQVQSLGEANKGDLIAFNNVNQVIIYLCFLLVTAKLK